MEEYTSRDLCCLLLKEIVRMENDIARWSANGSQFEDLPQVQELRANLAATLAFYSEHYPL
jgi:hypothetical protein